MGFSFICPICGNTDPKSIGFRNGRPYCRKCISFIGKEADNINHPVKDADIHIDYDLSEEQTELSNKILINYKYGIDTLVHAVCGSGKTEIVLQVISYAIKCGDSVGFAVPRRDVTIELFDRLEKNFKDNIVVSVYGGHTSKLEGDLIILTTHQLYRYNNYFDLLIIDEIDAFPFKDNEILNIMVKRSLRGHLVMMSATPSNDILKIFKQDKHDIVQLYSRFHRYPLPVPKLKKTLFVWTILLDEVNKLLKQKHPLFIFTPTIRTCENTYKLLSIFFKHGNCVHSKRENRDQIIKDFKNHKTRYLVTTAVLERGVTIAKLDVIVFNADSYIYDSHALIQISGRAGRKKQCPTGEVIFIAKNNTKEIQKCIDEIETANRNLQNMF